MRYSRSRLTVEENLRRAGKLCTRLNKLSTIHVKSSDTDLRMKVAGRKWINCDGKENFPDGEVFTSPLEDSTNGVITYTYPACYGGREVENVRLTFKDGVVTDFSAAKNYDFLKKMLEMDEGAKRVGEFAIGTNYHVQTFSKNTLFDEKLAARVIWQSATRFTNREALTSLHCIGIWFVSYARAARFTVTTS